MTMRELIERLQSSRPYQEGHADDVRVVIHDALDAHVKMQRELRSVSFEDDTLFGSDSGLILVLYA